MLESNPNLAWLPIGTFHTHYVDLNTHSRQSHLGVEFIHTLILAIVITHYKHHHVAFDIMPTL